MSDDSAFRKFLRLIGRDRDEYGSVPKYLAGRGAYIFKELVKSTRGKNNSFRIFSLKEIQKATNNFSGDSIWNNDRAGCYRGTIEDRHVAVKITWFLHDLLNEVVSLSMIKHRNVVKLLGCCLETEDPIVVHELPLNGTLTEYILNEELLWTDRLRIATEIADALSYLHSELHMTHGHLESDEAVLLDEFHSAKLAAFEDSRIQNQAESSDVETDIRNESRKNKDVHDFGTILLELLGIQKDDISKFTKCIEKVKILKYVKRLNVSEKEMPQIEAYIDLFLICRLSSPEQLSNILYVDGYFLCMEEVEDEPSMEEVARELRRIRSM